LGFAQPAVGAPSESLAPPPLLSSLTLRPSGLPPPGPPLPQAPAAMEPPRLLTFAGEPAAPPAAQPRGPHERPLPVSAPPPPPIIVKGPAAPAPPPAIFGGAAAQPTPVPTEPPAQPALGPAAASPGRLRQPNLLVRSVLGLRAFGRKEGGSDAPPPGLSAAPAPPAAPGAPRAESLLGLGRPASSAAPASLPPPVAGGYGGLAALRDAPSLAPRNSLSPPSPLERLAPGSGAHAPARPRTGATGIERPQPAPRRRGGGRLRQRGEPGEHRWWIGALAALGICLVVLGVVLVVVMVTRRGDDAGSAAAALAGSAAVAAASAAEVPPASDSGLPRSRLLTDDERLRSLLAQVHGRGKETAELRALLDEQAATAAQALQPGCVGAHCTALAEVGKVVTATGKKRVKRRSKAPDAMRSRWLAGLEMPEIPVEDDPRVQRRFEFYTENPLGRETFQQMLFRCGAYKDAIQSSLIRRGMPKDLIAVAFAESGCYPLAKSPAGAEGLWQFIPDAARAYHLRIIEGVVDERHSPQKATEAAIQYLSDMYAKFGEWDLVFSAYNMGPFGLAARLERVEGEDVGFWELVDAEMLPGETSEYAPAIQAIALILNNLQRLKFGAIQMRAPQMTMDLPVPPGTRMTMVARAAAMSLEELMRLNLDIKGTSSPGVQGFAVQVPKDSVWQAREALAELVKTGDDSDLCAPAGFDWGRQRFTPEMQEACKRSLGVRAPAPEAAPAPAAPP
jgi:Transglycosylase SLT domain